MTPDFSKTGNVCVSMSMNTARPLKSALSLELERSHQVTGYKLTSEERMIMDAVRRQRCLACGRYGSDPDHVTTVGASGLTRFPGADSVLNVWPLCRVHHVERGSKGLGHMISKYPNCRKWLEEKGRWDVIERIERLAKPVTKT